MSVVVGIDPGKDGAVCLLQNGSLGMLLSLTDVMPHEYPALFDTLRFWEIDGVFLEDVHASPQQGVVSAFTFGKGFGALLATCYDRYPKVTHLVRPSTWQAALGCMSQGNKETLFQRAKKEFPGAEFSSKHADAMLISLYGFKHLKYN
jgi:hypothetical protein